jgi:hypothetical protein
MPLREEAFLNLARSLQNGVNPLQTENIFNILTLSSMKTK